MRFWFLLIAPVALASCGNTAAVPPERIAAHESTCASYGFTPGSPEAAQCVATESRREQEERRERLAAFGAALQNAGNSMTAKAGTNCTSRKIGNTVQTNCY